MKELSVKARMASKKYNKGYSYLELLFVCLITIIAPIYRNV